VIREELESREEEIIRALSFLPRGFVLIGGYAVSALASHRFSMDCDIVTWRKDARQLRDMLAREGYSKSRSAKVGNYGRVEIYSKKTKAGKVSVDLFIDNITARETGATWAYEYVKQSSVQAIVSGVWNSASVLVPTRELLIATKIHSGRDADIRDIVMLSENADWNSVASHSFRGDRKILLERLKIIMRKIEDEQFLSSLKVAFELRRNVKPLLSSCKKGLSKLDNELEP
jgi:hypothetical protein